MLPRRNSILQQLFKTWNDFVLWTHLFLLFLLRMKIESAHKTYLLHHVGGILVIGNAKYSRREWRHRERTVFHVHCELNTLLWAQLNSTILPKCVSILSLRFHVKFGKHFLTKTILAWQTAKITSLKYWRIIGFQFKFCKDRTYMILGEVFIEWIHQWHLFSTCLGFAQV